MIAVPCSFKTMNRARGDGVYSWSDVRVGSESNVSSGFLAIDRVHAMTKRTERDKEEWFQHETYLQ